MTKEEMAKAYADGFIEEYREIAYDAFLCGFGAKCTTEIPNDLEEAALSRMRDPDMYLSDAVIDEIGDALLKMAQFGAKWDREQMMSEAIEATLDNTAYPTRLWFNTYLSEYSNDDKVRVIVLPKED